MSLKNKLMDKMQNISYEIGKEYLHHIEVLEDHMITIQENQVETEQYLKDIINRLDRIEKVKKH